MWMGMLLLLLMLQIIISGSGLKSPDKYNTAPDNTRKKHINSKVARQTIQQCRRRVLPIMLQKYTVSIQANDIMPDWCYGIIIMAPKQAKQQ